MAKNFHTYVGYDAANISASTHDMILLDIEYQPQICRMCHRMILDRFWLFLKNMVFYYFYKKNMNHKGTFKLQ